MVAPAKDFVTLKLPRTAVEDFPVITEALISRMHNLLERNTDGLLSATEVDEAETLVELVQFSQVVVLSLEAGKGTA